MYNFNNRNKGVGIRTGFAIMLLMVILGIFINLWVIPSAITSGVKALSNKCGSTYVVEKVWSGNWFCPEMTKNE